MMMTTVRMTTTMITNEFIFASPYTTIHALYELGIYTVQRVIYSQAKVLREPIESSSQLFTSPSISYLQVAVRVAAAWARVTTRASPS